MAYHEDVYRVSQKNPKTIENDLLLEFQCLALNWTHARVDKLLT